VFYYCNYQVNKRFLITLYVYQCITWGISETIDLVIMFQVDAGGALVIRRNNAWTQIGVGSFVSPAGCTAEEPAGYCRITYFRDWIRSQTGVGY
jgi:hypothetical protein